MTTTTDRTAPDTYYSPLLVELPDVHDAIDDAADSLSLALRSGTYRDGYERQLAGAVLANLDDETAECALWGLLCDRLTDALMTYGPLSEVEVSSYDTIAQAAKLAFDVIREQRDISDAVESMTRREISERQEHIDDCRAMGIEPHVDFMRRLRAEAV